MSSENDPPSSALVRSRSRLVRMLTSRKKNGDDDDAPARPSRRPAVSPAYSKEQRDAALRARGLLPPLSLSQQERELDTTIPIVKSDPPASEEMSAADLIKQQWEENNKDAEHQQRKRLNGFKFGPSANDLSSSTPELKEPKDEPRLDTSKSEQPLKKPTTKAQRRLGMHQASLSQPQRIEAEALRGDLKRSTSLQNKALPNLPAANPPLSPVLDLPTEFQSYLDTPPSPKQEAIQLNPKTAPSTPTKQLHGRRSPLPLKTLERPLPTPSNTLETPSSAVSPTDTLVNGIHSRADSPTPPAKSGPSVLTLDSASSTTKSNDSLTNGKGPKVPAKRVILVENGAHEAQSAEHVSNEAVSSSSHGHESDYEFLPRPPVPPREAGRVRKRGLIDSPTPKEAAEKPNPNATSNATPTRRKTINPFKRNQQPGSADNDDGATPTKRSLAMISRSVVGTVIRTRRDAENRAKDTSPPERSLSPPASPTRRVYNRSPPPPPQPVVVRQAVNPVYYSGGDIQAQANTIQDEEERRMAELAFLS